MMNKRGALVLRNVMFMIIVFGALMALMSIFVNQMSYEYSNTQMKTDYYSGGIGGLGDNLFVNVSDAMNTMADSTESGTGSDDSLLGSFTSSTGIIKGAATILAQVVKAPIYVGETISVMLKAINMPDTISQIISGLIISLIYALIIFVIVSALLKGGKV